MKRILLSSIAALMAAAAFAAPAQAQDLEAQVVAPCWVYKPVVECVRDAAIGAVNTAYGVIIMGGDLVDEVCDRVLGTCNVPTP